MDEDQLCTTCGHTTHNGQGYCLFCRTPFPVADPLASEEEGEPRKRKGSKSA